MPQRPRLVLAVCAVCALAGSARAQSEPVYRDAVKNVIEGTVRGMTISALVAEQHEKARASWKRAFLSSDPAHLETPHLLLYGSMPGKSLKEVGASLERQYALAVRALDMEGEEPWPGKLAVFLVNDRSAFVGFVRVVEQRRVEEGEAGSFYLDDEKPFLIAGPPQSKLDPPVDGQAGEQTAAALLYRKGGSKVPTWLLSGFGRATVVRSASPASQAAEHRRARQYLAKGKRSLRDVIGSGLADDESTILRASLLEYLAYSERTARFVPLVQGFRPTENIAEPTFDTALQAANLTLDRLDQVWQTWLKSLK